MTFVRKRAFRTWLLANRQPLVLCEQLYLSAFTHVQEARAKDMISQLKLEMNNLTRLVEAGAGLSIGEEATMNELLKQKEDLTKERDSQVTNCCILPA